MEARRGLGWASAWHAIRAPEPANQLSMGVGILATRFRNRLGAPVAEAFRLWGQPLPEDLTQLFGPLASYLAKKVVGA